MSATLIFTGANVNDADGYFGHWSNIRHYYHSCSGSQSSLTYCGYHHTSSSHCYSSSDEAGVRCVASNHKFTIP